MENRVEEFLKTCNHTKDPEKYLSEQQKIRDQILNSEEFSKELAKHSALSNKNRLLIYNLIRMGEFCNCTLARILELSEGSITHHIKKLEKAGLIFGRSRGHFTVYYPIDFLSERK